MTPISITVCNEDVSILKSGKILLIIIGVLQMPLESIFTSVVDRFQLIIHFGGFCSKAGEVYAHKKFNTATPTLIIGVVFEQNCNGVCLWLVNGNQKI